MKNLFLTCLFSALGTILFAQEKFMNSATETEALSLKVAELFKVKKYSKAISELAPYWPLPADELTDLSDQTTESMAVASERFGKIIGITKLKSETISDFAIRETYIVRYEFHAIRLVFTYYKNNSGWMVNGFKWDDKYTDEFK